MSMDGIVAAPRPPPTRASPARGAFLSILFLAFALDVCFLVTFVVNPVDFCLTSREAVDYIDVSFVYVRMVAAMLALSFGFLGFSLALRPVKETRRYDRALAVLAAEALAAICASGGLLGPSSEPRRQAITAVMLTHAAAAALASLHALLTKRGSLHLPLALDDVDTAPVRGMPQAATGDTPPP